LAQNWLKIGSKFKINFYFCAMKAKVYHFDLQFNWQLLSNISRIDRFDASWSSMEKKEGASLKQLKTVATIQSVGASTRIEGSKLSNTEVEVLLNNIGISKIEDRDSQEVVGYFNALDLIFEVFNDIEITDSNIKNLHNQLLKYSQKDEWHKGAYKQHTNAVQASFPDGTQKIIFRTTEPGYATDDAMRELVTWYNQEQEVHLLIRCAAFVYEFLSIHPFQDGNGRLSRLLTTLCLLKSGYQWIEYVSFEHEIEQNKKKYYRVLRSCQAQRPNEDISEWIEFFLESLINVQTKLQQKLESVRTETPIPQINLIQVLAPKEKGIYTYISQHPKCQSKDIAEALKIPKSTVKRILSDLVTKNFIIPVGKGAGVSYTKV
jgi:Fic family protein